MTLPYDTAPALQTTDRKLWLAQRKVESLSVLYELLGKPVVFDIDVQSMSLLQISSLTTLLDLSFRVFGILLQLPDDRLPRHQSRTLSLR